MRPGWGHHAQDLLHASRPCQQELEAAMAESTARASELAAAQEVITSLQHQLAEAQAAAAAAQQQAQAGAGGAGGAPALTAAQQQLMARMAERLEALEAGHR
jgi:small-conductance mechanosensitive channel